ncbi:Malonyl-CoA-acyl carrier protein transacylase, mitochondrial-like [Oopsacas minuta]|uniref:Malonyl-CoA-acyl carrier protein transacylase, mitochondrial-like n=1 Tax=Oopsacas minuta TaxID=111878 RepID=A0AAV7JKI3_9METZ|nr:Malonyl-CoA-acyl carrier protein transacylase, mitochondrial-like [Oopsacas minuta]
MSVIGLFPGQGAQHIGMLRHSLTLPSVQSLCKLASDTLGYDLAEICKSGPHDKLNKTEYCQPATLLASLSSHEIYTQSHNTLSALAGFSVGEISALAVSKSISYSNAFLFVKHRAEAMQEASDTTSSAMLSISGINVTTVQSILEEYNREKHVDLYAVIANYLAENTCAISLAKSDINKLSDRFTTAGARGIKLIPVSGGFHSQFMSSATEKILEIVSKIDVQLPTTPVYSNLTAQPYSSVEEISDSLVLQMTRPVQWYEIMKRLIERYQKAEFVELGFGKQLLSLLARIDRNAYKLATNIPP